MKEKAILIENVTVKLGNRIIIEGINLSIHAGEFWGIIGPNGGGKTTLLKTIIGTIKPVKGRVSIFGYPPETAVKKGWIGYLPQKIQGIVPFSVIDFVSLVGGKERAVPALRLVEMDQKKDMPFEKLSGGERQRVLIAAVLARDPKILLLDEPSTGVDTVAQDSFYNILRKLKEKGVTIVLVSHDVGVIAQFVDHIACLNRVLKYSGDPRGALDCRLLEELYGHEVNIFIHHPECRGCHILQKSS